MGYLGISISVLTSFIPIIVLVVGVSDSIHLLARYRKELRRPGMSGGSDGGRRREAVTRTLSHLAIPCFYTSLTTAVGFLSLVSTRIGIVMEFGAFTALAILATFGFSMTVFPVLLSFASARGLDDRGLHIRWIQQIVHGAAHLAANPSRTVLAAFVVVALLGLGAAASLRTNTLLMDDLRPRSGLLQDIRWIEQNGYGLFQVNLYLREDDRGSLHDPEVLVWMEAFQEFVSRDPLVVGTLGLPDYLRQLRRAMVDSDAPESSLPESSLPESREEASQLLFMAELQDADFAHDVYHREDGEAQVLVTVRDKGSVVILPLLERIDRYLADNPLPVGTVRPTGTVYLLQSYQARILESFGPSLIIALVVITGIMIYMFRSWRYGLIALIPNLFPLVVLLGVMRLGSFDLKPSTILVFSIAFGIAADDTIHLLGRFRQAIERGLGVTAALVDSVRDAGPAILMTTLVVGTGFSLLMASQFEVLFLVGLMTAVSALSAVIADLFAFPSIIRARWFGRRSYSAGLAATSLALAVLALRHGESVAQTPAEGRGRAIAEEADRRARGYGDLEARLTMVLRNRHGEERTRTMTMSLLEGAGANDKTLLVIDQPRDLQGTALLTHAESTGDDSQWLYLPALKRVKRIASGGQTGSFMGSEFSYEDIGSQGLDEYTYRFLGEEIIESEACLSVERVPVDPESGYARQVVFFDTGEYRVRQIDFYDRNGLLLKTLRLTGFQQYEGSFWRPDLMEMTNHQTGKSTSILWDEYRFDVGLTDRDFDRDRLKRAG